MSFKVKVSPVELGDGQRGYVRAMTLKELHHFRTAIASFDGQPDKDIATASLLVTLTACDESGKRIVPRGSENESEVESWDYRAIVAHFQESAKINGIQSAAPQ